MNDADKLRADVDPVRWLRRRARTPQTDPLPMVARFDFVTLKKRVWKRARAYSEFVAVMSPQLPGEFSALMAGVSDDDSDIGERKAQAAKSPSSRDASTARLT
jgi:hypothetical protein